MKKKMWKKPEIKKLNNFGIKTVVQTIIGDAGYELRLRKENGLSDMLNFAYCANWEMDV